MKRNILFSNVGTCKLQLSKNYINLNKRITFLEFLFIQLKLTIKNKNLFIEILHLHHAKPF